MTPALEPILTLAAEGGFNPLNHVVNHKLFSVDGWWIWSANQTNLVLAGLIMLFLGPWLAKEISTGDESEGHARYVSKHPFAQLVEVIAVYLREEMVRPLLAGRTERFMPFLWTLFFFILINNLLGLVPLIDLQILFAHDTVYEDHVALIGGTATQNIWVTAVLAVFSFIVINAAGVRELGVVGYAKHLTGGAPPALWFLMVPIEILGSFIKPIALSIRLFANMTGGHILVATLLGFVGLAAKVGLTVLGPVSILSVAVTTAVYFLEIFVAFLQAFIFMFLTTVFISQLSHHDEHHDDEHAHDGHQHDPKPALATA